MKIKKIAHICNKSKTYILYDKPSNGDGTATQWLGDGCAAYPLDGMPLLSEDSLCRMFDITEKRRASTYIKRVPKPEKVNMEDTDPGEYQAREMGLGILHGNRELIPLMTRKGITFIQNQYLSPLDGEEDMLELYERETTEGQTYIAAKTGMLIRAVIFPVKLVDEKFVNQLGDIQRECRLLVERDRPQEEARDTFQLTWTEEGPGESAP